MNAAVTGFSFGSIFMNIFLASSLQLLWKMLGAVQLMVHLPMMSVAFPSNALFAFQLIIDLANLKIVPVDKITQLMFKMKKQVDTEGFGYTNNMIQSLGVLFLGLCLFCLLVGLAFIFWKFFRHKPIVKKVLTKLYNMVIFNTFIRSFIAGYLVFAVASLKNSANLNFETSGDIISSILALIFATFCAMAPFMMAKFLTRFQSQLASEKFSNRCSTLYTGVKIEKTDCLLFNAMFCLRRLFFALVLVLGSNFPAL